MEYMTVKEAAVKWGCKLRWAQLLCLSGRIGGVRRFANAWMIPADAEKPADARVKSGKYINSRQKRMDANPENR